jgi:sigma-B regulation protein RsbU (phosphoserine phosphatase)
MLPLIEGGLLADLIWGEAAVIINDLKLDPNDPAAEHLAGIGSLAAIPLFDGGEALNMVLVCRYDRGAFSEDFLPEHVWLSNLFGRATANLVLRKELERAYELQQLELRVVADIQRSLLPVALPKRPGLDVAAYYHTSQHAGGDYYDFFELPTGELGLLVADVSGHGTPAAVMMAVTHAVAHTRPGRPCPPSSVLEFVNRALCERYTGGTGTFVTAFYAVYNPLTRELTYSSAGHNPPRLKRGRGGPSGIIDAAPALPLGIDADEPYADATQHLCPGDTLVLYTDGITEARDRAGELYGTERLDGVVAGCADDAQNLIDCIVADVEAFTGGAPAQDDRTLVVMRV